MGERITEQNTVRGVISVHRRGYAFLSCPGLERDVFIPVRGKNGAMDGDTVEAELLPEREGSPSPEGIVRKILKRNVSEIAGRLSLYRRYGEVIPEGGSFRQPVKIRPGQLKGARSGDFVSVQITRYPDRRRSAEGRVTEILAAKDAPGGDILAIARCWGWRREFSGMAYAQAKIAESTGILETDLEGRRDLRRRLVFTIDGADAKDFDDAVSLDVRENGNLLLGIHISDVSHYVREDSPLDKEARDRGTSVYLLDQVIPMLPEALSGGLCSLKPGEDRLTLSLDMEIDEGGRVVSHEIYESVICSAARLVYRDVSEYLEEEDGSSAAILERDPEARLLAGPEEIGASLRKMQELAGVLRKKREERGSIDFDLEEAEIRLDEDGRPVSVGVARRGEGERLIEDFMIQANETVAEHGFWMEAPFIYRVHDRPAKDRMEELRAFLREMGISTRGLASDVHPGVLRGILEQVRGSSVQQVVSAVLLRSMQKACYRMENSGHFGLASSCYCHFTSPIRRYPDLFVHRVIKAILHGAGSEELENLRSASGSAADSSSASERRAVEAEREVEKLKKAEYMAARIGSSCTGVISGVSRFGFFVELENTVEGIVPVTELFDDYYECVPEQYLLKGSRTGKIWRLGDSVAVTVESVDLSERQIRFVLA